MKIWEYGTLVLTGK